MESKSANLFRQKSGNGAYDDINRAYDNINETYDDINRAYDDIITETSHYTEQQV